MMEIRRSERHQLRDAQPGRIQQLDHGAIIVQKAIPVLDSDDEQTLSARILEQEHIAYSEAINIVLSGRYEVVGRKLVMNARAR